MRAVMQAVRCNAPLPSPPPNPDKTTHAVHFPASVAGVPLPSVPAQRDHPRREKMIPTTKRQKHFCLNFPSEDSTHSRPLTTSKGPTLPPPPSPATDGRAPHHPAPAALRERRPQRQHHAAAVGRSRRSCGSRGVCAQRQRQRRQRLGVGLLRVAAVADAQRRPRGRRRVRDGRPGGRARRRARRRGHQPHQGGGCTS